MSVITEFTKNVDARPFYAVVGATDLTVEKAREAAAAADARRVQFRSDFDKFVADLAPAKVQDRALAAFAQVQELPTTAAAQGKANSDKLVAQYKDLAVRGKKLVERVRNQQATKDLVAQAETTVAQVKGAVTTATKAANDIERSAKATVTTARKEAVKAAEAIIDSVQDEVKTAETEVAGAVKRTRTAAKRTSTTTRKAAAKTTTAAKGARTSATKTATATKKAAATTAAKVGD
ncbi:hypothetical protein [Phycicoccus elongatus]|jgi:heparin binding hemagglutinin HbhA|uniref:hypothetical protein n=1 Tax=Phycicoccus elongatus TaxID=101689 RepID=UPI0037835C86